MSSSIRVSVSQEKLAFILCSVKCRVKALKIFNSSNQRLGECVRPKMDSQVVAKEQDCWQTMQFKVAQDPCSLINSLAKFLEGGVIL